MGGFLWYRGKHPPVTGGRKARRGREVLLWRGVLDEFDALLDVAFKTLDASLEKLLLLIGDTVKNVDSLLDTVRL